MRNKRVKSFYSKPLHGLRPWSSERRPLLPIYPHPPTEDLVPLPELPSPPRRSLIDEWYTLSTHIIPAAFLRSSPDVESPADFEFSASDTREEKERKIGKLRDEYYDLKVRHWNASLVGNSEKRLWVCVNRYLPRPEGVANKSGRARAGSKKLTLFLAHANGYMKEIWEPVLRLLVAAAVKEDGILFDEIWSLDFANHGDSALINGATICALCDWTDHTRDILNFMLNFIPESMNRTLPVHLPRIPLHVSKSRQQHGFRDRTLVGVAHSLGGVVTALAAINCPSLFSSLILIDPILPRPPLNVPWITLATVDPSLKRLIAGALQRREKWTSREEALNLFKKNPGFAAWDPAVLEIYVECGLYSDQNNGVRLKIPGSMEAATLAERRTPFEVWDMLPELDETVELRFIMAEKDIPDINIPEKHDLVWLRPKNASNVKMPSTHLIVHEVPEELALDIQEFVQRKYGAIKAAL